MWTLWVAGAAYVTSSWLAATRSGAQPPLALAFVYVAVLTLLALLIRAVMLGRNWARVTYTVFASIAIVSILVTWIVDPASLDVVGIVLVAAYAAILVLLFHSASKGWFSRRPRNAT